MLLVQQQENLVFVFSNSSSVRTSSSDNCGLDEMTFSKGLRSFTVPVRGERSERGLNISHNTRYRVLMHRRKTDAMVAVA